MFALYFDRVYNDLVQYLSSVQATEAHKYQVEIATLQMFLFLFADDTVLVSSSIIGLQALVDCFANFCKQNQLKINVDKTKCMYVNM